MADCMPVKAALRCIWEFFFNKKKKDVFDRQDRVRTPPGRPKKRTAGNRYLRKPQTGITALIYLIINKIKVQIRGFPGFLLIE